MRVLPFIAAASFIITVSILSAETVTFEGVKLRYSLEKEWKLYDKKDLVNGTARIYKGPVLLSKTYVKKFRPSIGIGVEKIPPETDPVEYFNAKMSETGTGSNILKVYSKKDTFIKLPGGYGCVAKIKRPSGVELRRILITGVSKGYGILVICDTVEDTFGQTEKKFRAIIETLRVE